MTKKAPFVSVVIPAYNEATYIDRLLDALSRQNFKDFEVIVSDAQSNDGTEEVVDSFKDKLDFKFIESAPKGPAYGRNAGAAKARGEWLLFLDADDDFDDRDFIKTMVTTAVKNGWKTAGVKLKVKNASWSERAGSNINYRYLKLLSHTKRPVAPGYCILTKRALFESAKGFNEKIQFGEDYDYVTRVSPHGFGFVEGTACYVDLRRFRGEGFTFVIKGIKNEVIRHFNGSNLEKNPVKYEFGKHQRRQK